MKPFSSKIYFEFPKNTLFINKYITPFYEEIFN